MTVIARWTIEGLPGMDRELVNVSGPNIRFREQVEVVNAEDYDALAEQLRGAVEALRALHDAAEDYAPSLTATSAHAECWRDAMRRADAIIGGQ